MNKKLLALAVASAFVLTGCGGGGPGGSNVNDEPSDQPGVVDPAPAPAPEPAPDPTPEQPEVDDPNNTAPDQDTKPVATPVPEGASLKTEEQTAVNTEEVAVETTWSEQAKEQGEDSLVAKSKTAIDDFKTSGNVAAPQAMTMNVTVDNNGYDGSGINVFMLADEVDRDTKVSAGSDNYYDKDDSVIKMLGATKFIADGAKYGIVSDEDNDVIEENMIDILIRAGDLQGSNVGDASARTDAISTETDLINKLWYANGGSFLAIYGTGDYDAVCGKVSSNCNLYAMGALESKNKESTIIVGAANEAGDGHAEGSTKFNNGAVDGVSLNYELDNGDFAYKHFLLAPGYGPNGEINSEYAASTVAGTAALLWDKWYTLSSKDVKNILFNTADDLGDEGVDEVYGWGVLNIQRALSYAPSTGYELPDDVPLFYQENPDLANAAIEWRNPTWGLPSDDNGWWNSEFRDAFYKRGQTPEGNSITGNNIQIGIWDNFSNSMFDRTDDCEGPSGISDYNCDSHGNHVHSVIHSIAQDATITRFQKYQNLLPGGQTGSDGRNDGHNTDIMNVSLGYIASTQDNADNATEMYRQDWEEILIRNDKDTMIAVISAGNGSTTDTILPVDATCQADSIIGCNTLAGGAIAAEGVETIVVGALNADGNDLAYYSTEAGDYQDNYLVAPVNRRDLGVGASGAEGTSFSAPVVSGSVALILDKWSEQGITHKDATDIILGTAYLQGGDDGDSSYQTNFGSGEHTLTESERFNGHAHFDNKMVSDKYGHGVLNLEKALSPIGEFK